MLVGIFLMVGDEIIGLIAPSRQFIMHWPLGLEFTIWQSWEIVFVVILVCTIIYIILIEYLLKNVGSAGGLIRCMGTSKELPDTPATILGARIQSLELRRSFRMFGIIIAPRWPGHYEPQGFGLRLLEPLLMISAILS